MHTDTQAHSLLVWLSPRPLLLSVAPSLPSIQHFPSYFSFSLHITLPPSLPLSPPSPSLLGHVAAAPAEIIGAKAWGCYLHRNSMTPQAASGEGHRDHLSQNFNENFCWDRDFFSSATPPFFSMPNSCSFFTFNNVRCFSSFFSSALSVTVHGEVKLDGTSVLCCSASPTCHSYWQVVKHCRKYGRPETSVWWQEYMDVSRRYDSHSSHTDWREGKNVIHWGSFLQMVPIGCSIFILSTKNCRLKPLDYFCFFLIRSSLPRRGGGAKAYLFCCY